VGADRRQTLRLTPICDDDDVMYLTCPNCQTVYTVRAAMLREGQGEVRCGACQTLFNALDYLSDDLPGAAQPPSVPVAGPPDVVSAPPAEAESHALADGLVDDEAPAPETPRPDSSMDPDSPLAEVELPRLSARAEDMVPDALAQDWQQQRHGGSLARGVLLGALSLLLLGGLALQYMWFAPMDLMARFPQAAPVVKRFCDVASCELPQRRDASRFQILSREVRAHPRYEGALLVSATISNAAPWPQPPPRLRFRLYNVNGQTIASRTFLPRQYLDASVSPQAPLPPAQPLQIALEMLAPEEATVSFEIGFL
jgi:predicted Zn finger-like uncharacterized protein